MVIIIGNQKGGAGKSTLTLLLANYLVQVKKRKVTVIDMDYQQSIAQKFEKAKLLENPEPYEVIAASLDDYPAMEDLLYNSGEQVVLIDLPGKLDDDGLIPVFRSANLVICPFSYDEFSFNSTILFSVVLRKINPEVMLTYVPNRIKANVRYETQLEVDEQLQKLGSVTPVLPDRIDFQRTNTFQTPLSLIPAIRPVFEIIYQNHIAKPATP
ncbi:ParA family protein [Mucilaginibacter sp. FT3.2]|uniref:ParA family protein n=1 Tax=Mucilaginibacter sp. FT3.2 TaxID=2723090 RepID=UPI0016200AD0|nr:ParA family protein [Mucilaginibacter sp. FT3.2]